MKKKWILAFRTACGLRAGLEVSLKGTDVYVHYLPKTKQNNAHVSYHASGQKHIKKGRLFVKWTNGPNGAWVPMKWQKVPPNKVQGREEVAVAGWDRKDIECVLPPVTATTIPQPVEIPLESDFAIICLQVSVVGASARNRGSILGFPVFWRQRLSDGVLVEVEAFGIPDNVSLDEEF